MQEAGRGRFPDRLGVPARGGGEVDLSRAFLCSPSVVSEAAAGIIEGGPACVVASRPVRRELPGETQGPSAGDSHKHGWQAARMATKSCVEQRTPTCASGGSLPIRTRLDRELRTVDVSKPQPRCEARSTGKGGEVGLRPGYADGRCAGSPADAWAKSRAPAIWPGAAYLGEWRIADPSLANLCESATCVWAR